MQSDLARLGVHQRRRWRLLTTLPVVALVVGTIAGTGARAYTAQASDTTAATSGLETPALTPENFANPPVVARPKYRWWQPMAATDDAELTNELQQVKDAGAGGVEIQPFGSDNPPSFHLPNHTGDVFLSTYGWGTPLWSHKYEVMAKAAQSKGLILDSTITPGWPPEVPTIHLNSPGAQQQIVFGEEQDAAGSSRSGPLPTNLTPAPPTYSTKVCGTAAPSGATTIQVNQVGGFQTGDTITIGTGSSVESVKIASVGTSTPCTTLAAAVAAGATSIQVPDSGNLSVGDSISIDSGANAEIVTIQAIKTTGGGGFGGGPTPATLTVTPGLTKAHESGAAVTGRAGTGITVTPALTQSHPIGDTVADPATKTLIAVLVAQCATATCPATGGSRTLDPSSVVNVTDRVDASGNLSYAFPTGNGNPWWVIDFYQTADGQSWPDQVMPDGPSYVNDHLSAAGASIVTDYWDQHILNDSTSQQAVNQMVVPPSLFEDSLELSSNEKWTSDFLSQWQSLRGYSLLTWLPALAGAGAEGTGTSTGGGPGAPSTSIPPFFDFPNGIGDRVRHDYRQTWNDLYANNYLKALSDWTHQRHMVLRIQAYGAPIDDPAANTYVDIPEGESLGFNNNPETFKLPAVAAHMNGRTIVSDEQGAFFGSIYATTMSGAQGTDGQLPSIYKSLAGGVTQIVWHGFPYLSDPPGSGDSSFWPGLNAFGSLGFAEMWGPRVPQWTDIRKVNDNIARLSLVLRQGSPRFDVAVYREAYDESTAFTSTSPLDAAGYTYEYVSPGNLNLPDAVYSNGALFPNHSAYKALVLNNQTTMPLVAAQKILTFAQAGMPIVVVGPAPSSTPGNYQSAAQDAALQSVMTQLLAQSTVKQVASAADVPGALRTLRVQSAVMHVSEPTSSAILSVRRHTNQVDYYYLYNQSNSAVDQMVTLAGNGIPYQLNTWTGQITPIATYSPGNGGVTLKVHLVSNAMEVIGITPSNDVFGARPKAAGVHVLTTTADTALYDASGSLALRASAPGTYSTTLSNGQTVRTTISSVPSAQNLSSWSLSVDSWTPGPSDLPGDTAHTTIGPITVSAGANGQLPAWTSITPANGYSVNLQDVSGIGTYTTHVTLGPGWTGSYGAYLNLSSVVDTSNVWVNGNQVPPYDYVDPNGIDIGPYLQQGDNTITVQVASPLRNAFRVAPNTGASNASRTNNGLIGPVTLTPYAQQPISIGAAGPGTSPAFIASFTSSAPGQGRVYFGSGPGCMGLVEVATQDQGAGTTSHTVVVQGNELPGTVGDIGLQPGATYWYETVTVTKSGTEVDNNGGNCYSVTIPTT